MLLHSEVEMKSHPHPERPDRLRAIAASLSTVVKEARNDASRGGLCGGRGYGWGRGVGGFNRDSRSNENSLDNRGAIEESGV
ncbi:putative histone deacetylase [Helianthus debilis subsp. tardiflorus]